MRKEARWESRGWTATWSTGEILIWSWHSAQSSERNEPLSAHRTEIYYLILWVIIRWYSSMAWLRFLVYADVELSEFCKQKNSVKYFHSTLVLCVGLILFFRFIIIQPIFCFALFKLDSQTAEKPWLIKYSTRRCFQSQHSSLCWHVLASLRDPIWSTCCECSNITVKVTATGRRVKVKDRKCDGWHRGIRYRVTSLQPVTRLVSKFRNSLRYVIACPQNLYIFVLPVFRPVIPVFSELGDYAMEPSTEISNFIVGAYNQTRPEKFRANGP